MHVMSVQRVVLAVVFPGLCSTLCTAALVHNWAPSEFKSLLMLMQSIKMLKCLDQSCLFLILPVMVGNSFVSFFFFLWVNLFKVTHCVICMRRWAGHAFPHLISEIWQLGDVSCKAIASLNSLSCTLLGSGMFPKHLHFRFLSVLLFFFLLLEVLCWN